MKRKSARSRRTYVFGMPEGSKRLRRERRLRTHLEALKMDRRVKEIKKELGEIEKGDNWLRRIWLIIKSWFNG